MGSCSQSGSSMTLKVCSLVVGVTVVAQALAGAAPQVGTTAPSCQYSRLDVVHTVPVEAALDLPHDLAAVNDTIFILNQNPLTPQRLVMRFHENEDAVAGRAANLSSCVPSLGTPPPSLLPSPLSPP